MRTIYATNAILVLIVAAAFVVPRFLPPSEGFVAAADAVLVFLALLFVAMLVAIWLAAWSWRHRVTLPIAGRWLGLAPAVLGALALAALVFALRF